MKIFFDFDDFFLDTEGSMLADYFSLLKQLTGANDQDINNAFAKFSGAGFTKGELYSPKRHLEFLEEHLDFDSEKALEAIQIFFKDIRKYLFGGIGDFLRALSRNDIYLLTFGEKNFQNLKVDGTGLRDFFHEVIIVEGDKLEEIERVVKKDHFLSDEAIVFCDNRCGHFAGAKERNVITIHLRREADQYSKDPCDGCQYVVSNFQELALILKNL